MVVLLNKMASSLKEQIEQNDKPQELPEVERKEELGPGTSTEEVDLLIRNWVLQRSSSLVLDTIDSGSYQVHFKLEDGIVSLLCTTEWAVMAVSSDIPRLSGQIMNANRFVNNQRPGLVEMLEHLHQSIDKKRVTFSEPSHISPPSAPSFEFDLSSPDTLGDFGNTPINFSANSRVTSEKKVEESETNFREDTNRRVAPTPDDWEEFIFPGLEQFLEDEGMEAWIVSEWMRRVRQEYAKVVGGDYEKLFHYILRHVTHGTPPESIAKFFPDEAVYEGTWRTERYKSPSDASESTKRLLESELSAICEFDLSNEGIDVETIENNLFHWKASFTKFDYDSHISQELINYTLHSGDSYSNSVTGAIIPVPIELEIKFPSAFPNEAPLFRFVKPRIIEADAEDIFEKALEEKSQETLEATNEKSSHPLSFSRQLERSFQWKTINVLSFLRNLRTNISESKTIKIDMKAEKRGLPTVNGFWGSYSCVPASKVTTLDDDAIGGRIILPSSALNDMMGVFSHGGLRDSWGNSNSGPMIFEISARQGRRFFCGVLEFSASEGHVGIPTWMMTTLGIKEGSKVQVRRVSLSQGNFVKFQAHSSKFHEIPNNVKAMLEDRLGKFVALTENDTIQLTYDGEEHFIDVVECKPYSTISITDLDLSIDFATPLKEEQKEEKKHENAGSTRKGNCLSWSTGQLGVDAYSHETEESDSEEEESAKTIADDANPLDDPSFVEGKDFKICQNCKQRIGIDNHMHELQCKRMNWHCDRCNSVISVKKSKEEHEDEVHGEYICEGCGVSTERRFILAHKQDDCPARTVTCSYCELSMMYRQRWEHERRCGAMTEPCHICKTRVQRSELQTHLASCNGEASRRQNNNSRNDMFLCEKCHRPFTSFEELHIHYLTEHEQETADLF
eukprot:TRINITY_DN1934_c0_g2_i3.p1 TRINITY_DN1934_c0_g2~~TRINITY_DN1934_c0_g2_i3.p1  ORF type:complete len:904 (-),score=184.68 TRINITY_DN1934_c0_g2_i3:147-2858(-)